MNYIAGFCDEPMSIAESQDEAAAAHQINLDLLYSIGCEYGIKDAHMQQLCAVAQINFNELQKYSGTPATC